MNAKSSSRKGAGKKTPEPGSVVLKLRERVFVYRNLRETIFPERATAAGLANAKERLEEALQAACIEKGYELKPFTVPFETLLLGDQEKPPVLQDYTLPANAGSRWKEAAWYFICGGNMVVALNAEDHLTVMALEEKNGPAFEGAYKRATELAAAVGKRVPFARSPEFGYLSSNPEHAGTGLFFSVDICLAGMGLLRTLEPALRALERLGFNVYPAFGRDAIPDGLFSYPRHLPPDGWFSPADGSAPQPGGGAAASAQPALPEDEDFGALEVPGYVYRIEAAQNVGGERDILSRLQTVLTTLETQECKARQTLRNQMPEVLDDFFFRSLAVAAGATLMPLSEGIDIFYALLLASEYGCLTIDDDSFFNPVFGPQCLRFPEFFDTDADPETPFYSRRLRATVLNVILNSISGLAKLSPEL